MTLFEALKGGAFHRLNWQHSGEFDQNFSKYPGVCPGGGGMGGLGIDQYLSQTWKSQARPFSFVSHSCPLAKATVHFSPEYKIPSWF